jgi:hypothetical protein
MIDPKNSTPIKCESCENETFVEVVFLRKISKLLTGQPQDTVIPIPTFKCSSCNHINKDFKPDFNTLTK